MDPFKHDILPDAVELAIVDEAKGTEVDGKHVLAKVSGSFFVPNGVSRNNRFYSKSLWEKVISDSIIKKKLSERRMFGTISHEQPLTDSALLEGKLSHIVTNLELRGDQGFGEALILDTPAGRALNTVLRAGAKMFVSSRANGTFKGEEKGVPAVDPETYLLESFDFVMDPGFLQANPKLVESLKESLDLLIEQGKKEHNEADKPANESNSNLKENTMSDELKKLLESATKENGTLRSDVDKAIKEVETLKNENAVLQSENDHVKGENDKLKEKASLVDQYEDLGTPDEVAKAIDVANEQLDVYGELGKPADVKEQLKEYATLKEALAELGDDATHIAEALDTATKVVEAYNELGSPDDIKEAFDKMDAQQENMEEEVTKKLVTTLATELKVSEEKIKTLHAKGMSEAEIRAFFKDVAESKKPSRGQRLSESLKKNVVPKNDDEVVEEDDKPSLKQKLFEGNTGQKLNQYFGGKPLRK